MDTILRCLVLDRQDRYLCTPDSFHAEFKHLFSAAINSPIPIYTAHPVFIEWFRLNKSLRIQGHALEVYCHALEVPRKTNECVFNSLSEKGGFLGRFQDTVVTMARRLVVTTNGHIGMAPSRAKKGDLVCILFGGSIPVVLRRRDIGYEFIGECYLDGFMNGDGPSKDQGTTVIQFRLV